MKVVYTIEVKVEIDKNALERLVEELKDNPYCITHFIDNANRKNITATVVLVS
jgi:hypothetical protein